MSSIPSHPEFTAIVSCFRHERFIAESLQSLLRQTRPVDRIVFFDDGSPDRSLEIARDMLASHPNVIYLDALDQNRGFMTRMVEAHQRIERGRVLVLSCDDTWEPDSVATHESLILAHDAQWTIGGLRVVDADGREVGMRDPVASVQRASTVREALLRGLLPTFTISWSYDIGLYRRVGGLDRRWAMEDYPLALRFSRTELPAMTSKVVASYRQVAGSMTNSPKAVRNSISLAELTLAESRYEPLAALPAAADRYLTAAAYAKRYGDTAAMVRCLSLAALLWPSPRRLARELGARLRRP